jgi:BirA family biotin operon repressor/biotin-[acetyl-CoA-carboxylase] ligase
MKIDRKIFDTVPNLPEGFDLHIFEQLDSTNEKAKELARDGAPDGTLVWAGEQLAGRGRHGRNWLSPKGNLYCTYILRPDCDYKQAMQMSFVAALAVGETLKAFVPQDCVIQYKWPNDVLVNGQKISGILIETEHAEQGRPDWLAVGIGINVQSHPDPQKADLLYAPTSITAQRKELIDVAAVLMGLTRKLFAWRQRWVKEGFAPVREQWLQQGFNLGQPITVKMGLESLTGIFMDIDEHGTLILKLSNGTERRITTGDVFTG